MVPLTDATTAVAVKECSCPTCFNVFYDEGTYRPFCRRCVAAACTASRARHRGPACTMRHCEDVECPTHQGR